MNAPKRFALRVTCGLGFALALLQFQPVTAQGAEERIDPEADKVIRAMGDFLAAQPTFSFEAEILYETVFGGFDGGPDVPAEKIVSARRVTSTVRRPNAFFVSIEENPQSLEFYFDGATLVLNDNAANAYVKKAFSGSTDEALKLLREAYKSDPPLSDLLESNLYDTHMKDVDAASYIGVTRLRGQEVHQVAFASEGMDWQVWITTGDQPIPVLLQILARDEAYWPYFQAWFTNWEFGLHAPDDVFAFTEPENGISTQFVEDADLAE